LKKKYTSRRNVIVPSIPHHNAQLQSYATAVFATRMQWTEISRATNDEPATDEDDSQT
jgi:hypothetical protein